MKWQIDDIHSQIQFKIRHMMVSWASGCFERFSGTINLDEDCPEKTTINILIDVASINTRQADRNAHLRGPAFFDVVAYSVITFKSSKVTRTGAGTAMLTGDLTIREVTHEVTLNVTYSGQE